MCWHGCSRTRGCRRCSLPRWQSAQCPSSSQRRLLEVTNLSRSSISCLPTRTAHASSQCGPCPSVHMHTLAPTLLAQVLIILTNMALVLALSPAAQLAAPPPAGTFGAYMAGLPSYFLQSGDFSAAQRAVCLFSKVRRASAPRVCGACAGSLPYSYLCTLALHNRRPSLASSALAPRLLASSSPRA